MTEEGKYLSPLVSCVECKKEYSTKGIFTHFQRSHGTEQEKSKYGGGYYERVNEAKSKINERQYLKNPNLCRCGVAKTYKQRNNKFCSHSCAATHTNNLKDKSFYKVPGQKLKEMYSKQCFYPKLLPT